MLDTYTNFAGRCFIDDLPNEQFFKDAGIELLAIKHINHQGKVINAVTDTYNTNLIAQVNLSQYKYIFAIKKVECIVANSYSTFNITVTGIKSSALNTSNNISVADMSVLCLENADQIGKVMEKYFPKK